MTMSCRDRSTQKEWGGGGDDGSICTIINNRQAALMEPHTVLQTLPDWFMEYHCLATSFITESALQYSPPPPSHTPTHQDPQVPLLVVVWCTPGGGGPHVLTLLEHSWHTLEGQLEVILLQMEEEQTTSVYQNSHNTLPSLLGRRVQEYTCMVLSMGLELLLQEMLVLVHLGHSMTTCWSI